MDSDSVQKIAKDTAITAGAALIGLLLGLLKNIIVGSRFGTSLTYDAFLIAFTIPQLITSLALTGISNFVPIFSQELRKKPEKEAWEVANRLLTFWILAILLAILSCYSLLPFLIQLVAPGFDKTGQALALKITDMVLVSAIFIGLSDLANSISYSYQQFSLPALSGTVSNVIIISFLLVSFNLGIYGLTLAVVLGSAAQLFIQIKVLRKVSHYFRFVVDFKHSSVRQAIRLTIPLYIGQGGAMVENVVQLSLASTLPAGTISALAYGLMITEVPRTIFSASISTVFYPIFSKYAEERDRFLNFFFHALKTTTLIILPVSIGLITLATPIVKLLFERGAFSSESTRLTVVALSFFAIGLLGDGLNRIYTAGFQAQKNTKTPAMIGLARGLAGILLSFLLIKPMGIAGLALASAISQFIKLILQAYFFSIQVKGLRSQSFKEFFFKVCLASAVMGGAVYVIAQVLKNPASKISAFTTVLSIFIPASSGALVFLIFIPLLRLREGQIILNFMKTQIKNKFQER